MIVQLLLNFSPQNSFSFKTAHAVVGKLLIIRYYVFFHIELKPLLFLFIDLRSIF